MDRMSIKKIRYALDQEHTERPHFFKEKGKRLKRDPTFH